MKYTEGQFLRKDSCDFGKIVPKTILRGKYDETSENVKKI